MDALLLGIVVALSLAMILSLYRVLRGPTVFDRLTGVGLIGTKTVVLLVAVGQLTRREAIFVDISLAYGLISFVGTIVLAKYFERKEAGQS